mmetsp:Transcript_54147/g.127905  ORF Transcript_54147/g.127905 Transcript_54147/m.127905 type:complete len:201 (+) Transcript_54147:171-773(+)
MVLFELLTHLPHLRPQSLLCLGTPLKCSTCSFPPTRQSTSCLVPMTTVCACGRLLRERVLPRWLGTPTTSAGSSGTTSFLTSSSRAAGTAPFVSGTLGIATAFRWCWITMQTSTASPPTLPSRSSSFPAPETRPFASGCPTTIARRASYSPSPTWTGSSTWCRGSSRSCFRTRPRASLAPSLATSPRSSPSARSPCSARC